MFGLRRIPGLEPAGRAAQVVAGSAPRENEPASAITWARRLAIHGRFFIGVTAHPPSGLEEHSPGPETKGFAQKRSQWPLVLTAKKSMDPWTQSMDPWMSGDRH